MIREGNCQHQTILEGLFLDRYPSGLYYVCSHVTFRYIVLYKIYKRFIIQSRITYLKFPQVTKLLLENGADVEMPDNYGQSPLFMACWKGHATVAQLLLEYRANIGCRTKTGITPLFQVTISLTILRMRSGDHGYRPSSSVRHTAFYLFILCSSYSVRHTAFYLFILCSSYCR